MPQPTLRRTLMRPPVVKKHTTPRSGFFAIFPLHWSWRHRSLTTCADLIAMGRPRHTVSAPHTYGGSVTIAMVIAGRRCVVLCGLETYPYPHTVLGKVRAQRLAFASEGQVRGRGSTPVPGATLAASRARADVQAQAKGSGLKSLGTLYQQQSVCALAR